MLTKLFDDWDDVVMLLHTVISPDLVREVEARMKRNYLPPSLANYPMGNSYTGNQNCNVAPSQSPPLSMPSITTGQVPSNGQRRYGRTYNKLPTVMEVGELF